MRAWRLPFVVAFALAACGRRSDAPPPPTVATDAAPVPIDAGPPPVDAAFEDAAVPVSPEEAAARADRPTGLPGAGRPEVVTEILMVMMATGRAERRGLVDGKLGAWEVTLAAAPSGDRIALRCATAADKLHDDNLGRLVDRQIGGRAALSCDNQRAAAPATPPDPRAGLGRHMLCVSPAAGPDDGAGAMLFVPDPERGARFLAAITAAPGAPLERAWPLVARALARPGARCR